MDMELQRKRRTTFRCRLPVQTALSRFSHIVQC